MTQHLGCWHIIFPFSSWQYDSSCTCFSHDPMHRKTNNWFLCWQAAAIPITSWRNLLVWYKKCAFLETNTQRLTNQHTHTHTHTHTQSAVEGSGLGAHICWCSHKNSNKGRLFFSYLLFLRHVGCSLISPTWIKTLRPLPVAAKHTVGCCWMPFLFCPEL